MAWWRKKKIQNTGSVLFRGKLPPRSENFEYLRELGIELSEAASDEGSHWALNASHPTWGDARIVCLRDAPMPPTILVQHDPRLLPQERDLVALAGSSVCASIEQDSGNVLLERKRLLRYLRALMADDGLVAVDHTAQAFWSRADLDDELAHEAELDVLSLFTMHLVTDDSERVTWMHSHGLQEMGYFDFDLIDPSPDLADANGWDLIRAIAFAIVEGHAEWDGAPFTIAFGIPAVRFVPASTFRAQSGAKYPDWVEMLDDEHVTRHAVVCDRASRFRLFARKPRPCEWLSGPLDDDMPLRFSDVASELMARRAVATWEVFRAARAELEELELPSLVKLRYEDQKDGSVEHLWFETHETNNDSVAATLINEPFGDIGIRCGERKMHDLERLTDWSLMSPFGMVTPRSTRLLRALRENREDITQALREAREGNGEG